METQSALLIVVHAIIAIAGTIFIGERIYKMYYAVKLRLCTQKMKEMEQKAQETMDSAHYQADLLWQMTHKSVRRLRR